MKSKKLKMALCFSFAAVLLAILIAFTVVLASFDDLLVSFFGQSVIGEQTRAAGEALATQIVEEGVVLVENKDNALPLNIEDENENKVAVLGWASTQWVQGGSGSGRSTDNYASGNLLPHTTFLKALDVAGVSYDKTITNYYSTFCNARPFYAEGNGGSLSTHDYEYCRLIEPGVSAISSYKKMLENAAENYNTAIVVISRISGESIDCPTKQYKNYTSKGDKPGGSGSLTGAKVDSTRTYLDVSTEEEELLEFATENFNKVIVLINNTNAMNLGFLKKYDVDAAIIAGGTGNNSVNGLINIVYGQKLLETKPTSDNMSEVVKYDDSETGKVLLSPSGRTVDTYVYDFRTNPSFAYTAMDGVSQYSGSTSGVYPTTTNNPNVGSNDPYPGVSYLDYIEGIYVGYKWYETADADGFWKSDFAKTNFDVSSYDEVVQYPFGYGLSYTNFQWEVQDWDVSSTKITVKVNVTNVGTRPGQDVVQLYYTPPYNKDTSVEKAAVNLGDFAKTTMILDPNDPAKKSQLLTLSLNIQDMASYDQYEDEGAYVLEAGKYELSLRSNAHTVVPQSKVVSGSRTYTYTAKEDVVYNKYAGSNGSDKIRNLFIGENNSDGVAIDGSDSNQEINWLSRATGFEEFPLQKAPRRAWSNSSSKLIPSNMYKKASADTWDATWLVKWRAAHKDQPDEQKPDYGSDKGTFKLAKLDGKRLDFEKDRTEALLDDVYLFGNPENYDKEDLWNLLLNQIDAADMRRLVLHGYTHEEALTAIGKPETNSFDGPAQIASFNKSAFAQIGYPMPTVLAQTWNPELATAFGLTAAQQARGAGDKSQGNVDGWYAPGANLHRSAFGGRNYEYYSEDPYLSGVMCANTVRGALNGGVYTYIKHVIGYDQESLRDGLYCWMTEQALRENYLKPFKMAVDKGASGLMSSYGRIGAVWAGGSESLLTDLLRKEWGFKGTVLTDYADHQDFMNGDQMLRAGGDLWMDGMTQGSFKFSTSSEAFKYQLRQATKHIIYTWANAMYEAKAYIDNGGDKLLIEQGSIDVFKWWWIICAVVDVLCAGGAALLIWTPFRKKKPKKSKAGADGGEVTEGESNVVEDGGISGEATEATEAEPIEATETEATEAETVEPEPEATETQAEPEKEPTDGGEQ